MAELRREVAEVAGLRHDLAGLAELRTTLAGLDPTALAELLADVGRLRSELTEQLSSEMLVERVLLRTPSTRTAPAAPEPATGSARWTRSASSRAGWPCRRPRGTGRPAAPEWTRRPRRTPSPSRAAAALTSRRRWPSPCWPRS
ncbi:MAG: hypothetical protein M3Q47_00225 [Actinomycetota bacterium]|nr:hypothetical protein [Actinomycetota bacterium]